MQRVQRWARARRMRLVDLPLWALGMFLSLIWVAPFVWMVSTSLKPPDQVLSKYVEWLPRTVVLDNYIAVFEHPLTRWAINSVIVSVSSTVLAVMVGALAGYALARLHFPGRRLLFAALLASIMIPSDLSIVPLYIMFLQTHLTNNYVGMVLPSIASVVSVYIFRQFFLRFPREIEDAAAIDGASRARFFISIALPMARAPLAAASILLLTSNWNAYLWPLLMSFSREMKTLPVGIAEFSPGIGIFSQGGFGPPMAAATILSMPSILVFLLLQRYFIEGVARSGIKG